MGERPRLNVFNLDDLQKSAGAGVKRAHVMTIEHLREAPEVHLALMEAEAVYRWVVKNPGQVAAARDMELALRRMAGALVSIGRGGDNLDPAVNDLGPAVNDLEIFAKEFATQGIFGTERTLGAVSRPALEVVRCARDPLANAARLLDLVSAAAGKVEWARELRVRLDPDQAPLIVKSMKDIVDLAPSSDEDAPPQPEEEAWCVGPVVVVTGLDYIHESSDIRLALARNRDSKGWRVLGVEKVRQIEVLDEYLWGNMKRLRRSDVLFNLEQRGIVVNQLERHAFKLFEQASGQMNTLQRDPGFTSGICEIPGQVHELVEVARTEPMDATMVCCLAGVAVKVIELVRRHPVTFWTPNDLPPFVI